MTVAEVKQFTLADPTLQAVIAALRNSSSAKRFGFLELMVLRKNYLTVASPATPSPFNIILSPHVSQSYPQLHRNNSLSISVALSPPVTNTLAIQRLKSFVLPRQTPSSRNLTAFYPRMEFRQKSSLTMDHHSKVTRLPNSHSTWVSTIEKLLLHGQKPIRSRNVSCEQYKKLSVLRILKTRIGSKNCFSFSETIVRHHIPPLAFPLPSSSLDEK